MATDIRLEFLEAYRLCPKVVFGSRVQEDEEIIGTGQMLGRQLRPTNCDDILDNFAIQHSLPNDEVCYIRKHGYF